ncbi:MAG: RNA methyltransferase [Pseudomonadota bacterium]
MVNADRHRPPGDEREPQYPVMVLVHPQMGENIGAAARAMWNFGLERMRLVRPRDGWPNARAVAMAAGATRVLDRAGLFDTTVEAVADANFVFATTARDRHLTKPVMTPERAMEHARALTAAGQKVAILFGSEQAGLKNDDVARSNAIVSVPVNPVFSSLNLAQCVLLVAYEWRRQTTDAAPEITTLAKDRWAEAAEIEKLQDHFEERLEAARFFWPEEKAPAMKTNLRNLFSRLPLTIGDVRIFHGVLRALTRRPK